MHSRAEPISRNFLAGPDVLAQARGLLGVEIHTHVMGEAVAARIVETEAYRGCDDKAAHSYAFRRTARTEVFFGPPGHAYIYLIYGIHRMFNIVVGRVDEPNAILVRAVEPISGLSTMHARRKLLQTENGVECKIKIANGPGLLCQALGIERHHYGVDLFEPTSPIQLKGFANTISPAAITDSSRVGVVYAAECAQWPWRFRVSGNPFTSPAR